MRKISKKIFFLLSVLLVAFAFVLMLVRLFAPAISKYKHDVEAMLSSSIGSPVQISQMKTSWYGLYPIIRLEKVVLRSKLNKPTLFINKISIGINVWQTLINRRLKVALLFVDGANIYIKKGSQGQLQIRGFDSIQTKLGQQALSSDPQQMEKLFFYFLKQNDVRIKNIYLNYQTNYGQWQLSLPHFKFINNDSGHHFMGKLFVNKDYKTSVHLIGHFKGRSFHELEGKYYVATKHLPIDVLNQVIKLPKIKVVKGDASFQVWGRVHSDLQTDGKALVTLKSLLLENLNSGQKKSVQYFNGDINFSHGKKATRIAAKHIELSPYKTFTQAHSLLYEREANKQLIQVSHLGISWLRSWAQFFNAPLPPSLSKLHFHGTLKDSQLVLLNNKPAVFFGQFKNLGWHSQSGFTAHRLTGEVYADEQQGFLSLNSSKANITLPAPYNRSVQLNLWRGDYQWKKLAGFWRLVSDNTLIQQENISLSPTFSFDWYGSLANSYLTLDLGLVGQRLEELKPYLDSHWLKPRLKQWFDSAINSAPNLTGHIYFKGRLGDMPFNDQQGTFLADLNIDNSDIKFHKHWPAAKGVDANLIIKNDELLINASQLSIAGKQVKNVKLVIAPLVKGKTYLYLNVKESLKAKSALKLISQSPLKQKLAMLDKMVFDDRYFLNLQLNMPLSKGDDRVNVEGAIGFNGNTVTLFKNKPYQLNKINGQLYFNEQGIVASRLTGRLFDSPLTLRLYSTTHNQQNQLNIMAKGGMALAQLKNNLPLSALESLSGFIHYQFDLTANQSPQKADSFSWQFKTNLQKAVLDLPAPFTKPLGQIWPLIISGKNDHNHLWLDLALAKKLYGKLKLDLQNDLALTSAAFSTSDEQLALPEDNHLYLYSHFDELSVKPWAKWYQTSLHHPKAQQLALKANILIDKLDVYGMKLTNFDLMAESKDANHHLLINSSALKGKVEFNDDLMTSGIQLNLDYLFLPKWQRGQDEDDHTFELPPIKLDIQRLVYNNIEIGQLQFNASQKPKAWVIDKFHIHAPSYEVKLVGHSQKAAGNQRTSIEGYWQSHDLASTLKQWQIEPVVDSKKTTLQFKLHSNKVLSKIAANDLSGTLELVLKQGRITHLSKDVEQRLGLGKLISILSLQTLPRRLVLDFSDLSKKGFSFDSFSGHFALTKGSLKTGDAALDGPVALVKMSGALNIVKKYYDLTLKISPHITASLPVVATIAGGPIAGVATWVASKIINKSMNKVTAYTYKISGPWHKPIIQQMSITKKHI